MKWPPAAHVSAAETNGQVEGSMNNLGDKLTRRQVIKIGATTAVLSLTTFLGSPPAFAAAPLRKNIDSLSTEELDNYKHAVKILKDRSAANPAAKDGYVWQAALHNDFDRIRPDGEPGGCEHRSERFFPWHRAHLAGFEKILRETDPARTANVTIPFWDWTLPASGVRFPGAFEDMSSPLFHNGRYHKPSDVPEGEGLLTAIQWDADEVRDRMVRQPDWFLFAGNPAGTPDEGPGVLEKRPHNKIHPSIGPTMGEPSLASQDPIYWSFHAYIDLVWARWQRLHTDATHPQPFSAPQTKIFVEPFMPVIGDMAQTDTLPTGFQYGYDYDFSIDAALLILASSPANRTPLTVVQKGERHSQSGPIRLQPSKLTLLQMRNVAVIRDVTYDIDVYVHPPSVDLATLSAAERARYLADSATVWMSGGHAHRPTSIYFDLTKAIAAFGGDEFSISIISRTLPLVQDAAQIATMRADTDKKLTEAGPLWGSLVLEER
jgi:hypothetical protein